MVRKRWIYTFLGGYMRVSQKNELELEVGFRISNSEPLSIVSPTHPSIWYSQAFTHLITDLPRLCFTSVIGQVVG